MKEGENMGKLKPFGSNARMYSALYKNDIAYRTFFDLLKTMYMAKFDWTAEGIFSTIDTRFLEEVLFYDGRATVFREDVSGFVFVLPFIGGQLKGVYAKNRPTRVHSPRFGQQVNEGNSVVIYEKSSHFGGIFSSEVIPPIMAVSYYASQLSNISRAMDVNLSSLRTPLIFSGDEKQKLTIENLMRQYDANQEFIFMADRDNSGATMNPIPVSVINTGVPFMADKFQSLFSQKWQEAMTAIGIQNANVEKKERLLVDEVNSNNTQVSAITYSQLKARESGAETCMVKFARSEEDVFAVSISDAVIQPMDQIDGSDTGGDVSIPTNQAEGDTNGGGQ